jgi:transcriptional regulator with XRE-family HTH domain
MIVQPCQEGETFGAMPGVRDPALLSSLAAELKARRSELRFSQEELAHRSGLQPLFIVRVETCVNQPSLTAFVMIAKGLGTDPGDLLKAVLQRYRKETSSSPAGAPP